MIASTGRSPTEKTPTRGELVSSGDGPALMRGVTMNRANPAAVTDGLAVHEAAAPNAVRRGVDRDDHDAGDHGRDEVDDGVEQRGW